MGRYAYPNATELFITADAGAVTATARDSARWSSKNSLMTPDCASLWPTTHLEEEFAAIKLRPSRFHGDWNYRIS